MPAGAPTVAPPAFAVPPDEAKKEPPNWIKKLGPIGTFLLVMGAKLKSILSLGMIALKVLPFGKVLLTSGSMLVSIWFYSLAFGWPFAVGFVVLIFIHEMGHVYVAWRQGHPVSAPVFIPGMGALILAKFGKSVYQDAIMGIGGPVAGTIGSVLCWALYSATGATIFLGLATIGFLLNLFNLTPIFPLDGGWIVAAISPYLWAVGLLMMGAMFIGGFVHNPIILIIIIMGIPRLIQGFKKGSVDAPGAIVTTPNQKLRMGAAYLGLCGFLIWAMAMTTLEMRPPSHLRLSNGQVAKR